MTAGRIAVLGARTAIQGFGLGGALVLAAEDPAAVRRAWSALPPDVAVVVLTRAAHSALDAELAASTWPLVAVMS